MPSEAASAVPKAVPKLGPGVSRELAAWRASRYRDVAYALKLDIASSRELMRGSLELAVTLSGAVEDLVLDWRPTDARARVFDITVNGREPAGIRIADEHVVVPRTALRRGVNRLRLQFESPMAVSGAAVTRYRDREDGSEYVYTLFVPSDASTAFPCFDQPDLKGRYALEVTAPGNWKVVSNTAGTAAPDAAGGTRTWRFAPTAPLSSYLLAFAAGEFAELREPAGATVLYVRKSQLERARAEAPEVLRLNREAVAWLAGWFDAPLPFAKYDLVLLPEFPYGGMEHAGATFLREDAVLFPSVPNENDQLRRAQLLFHEAAHQWFGNLVTMRWFDDLWLKEGFANFMAAKATEALLPRFDAWNAFHSVKVAAYRTDVTRGTTPIYQALPNLSAAKSAYGSIVYSKAPGVLRQAEFYVGEEAFQRAVRRFVKRHAWAAADWSDLVRALQAASGRDLTRWARAWVQRRGMPRVRLEWKADAAGRIRGAALRQEDVLGEGGTWPMRLRVALAYRDGTTRSFDAALDGRRARLPSLDGQPVPDVAFANHGDYGYGQFLLDPASREALLARPETAGGGLLRSLLLDALWESVREAELDPGRYIDFALRVVGDEQDPVTLATLLARTNAAFLQYLPAARKAAIASRLEEVLAQHMHGAGAPGRRISFLRAFMESAYTTAGRERLKRLFGGTETVPDVPLSSRDRFRIVQRLLVVGDPEAGPLLEQQQAADPGDDGRRYAYAAGAARRDAATKRRYFEEALYDASIPESWIESALAPLNAIEHDELTRPLLDPALAALPDLKRSRKIFFLANWLAAFLGGQTSAAALQAAERHARDASLDPDLKLKLLEHLDALERTVRIRGRFGGD